MSVKIIWTCREVRPERLAELAASERERTESGAHETRSITYDSLDDLLGQIHTSGWPICPECGEDCDFEISKGGT